MKTHTLHIDGQAYDLRLTGTVGIHILAQSFVPDEADRYTTVPGDSSTGEESHHAPTPKWLMALLYAIFYTCHEKAAEKIDFLHFIMSFSGKEFQEAMTWYYEAYAEREGLIPATVPDDSSSAEDVDQKNA